MSPPLSGFSVHADGESGTHRGWLLARVLASHPGDAHLAPGTDDDLLRLAAIILDS